MDDDHDRKIPPIATHDDVEAPPIRLLPGYAVSAGPRPYSGGAYHHRSSASGTTDYLGDYRHTRRHDVRHAPCAARPSHTSEEEDIGSSDSSSNSSDYSSDSDGSRDELDDDDVPSNSKGGFGFSAATWASTDPPRERTRRPRVIYQDRHYEKKDIHYVMEERRYYPARHVARGYSGSYAPRRVSPEPLYREYREYRENRHARVLRTSRSSQTSPARVEPIHATGPRSFVRTLTPTPYRRAREEREERDRERERQKHRELQRAKYQYESRVPPPPPSLSAPLTLRPPPPLSSNASHYDSPSPKPLSKRSKTSRDDDDDDDDDDYQPVPTDDNDYPVSPPAVPAKRPALLAPPGGSSTSTFALSGGPSAPANNNGTTSTTTTFHVTTPRAISASLAAAQNALSQPGTAAAQAEAEKAEAEKMRIPSFKRGGKTRYQCVYCSKDFSRKNDAYRHMSRKHNDNATEFICVCGRVLSRGDALTRHMRTCRESKEKGGATQIVLAIAAGAFGSPASVPPAKMVGPIPGSAAKRKAGKKRKRGVSPAGMELDGEDDSIDNDVSMEEED